MGYRIGNLDCRRCRRGVNNRRKVQVINNEIQVGANVLIASGLIYAVAYLVVGIAVNVRYFLWTIMAVQTAFIVALAEPTLRWGKRETLIIAVPVAIMALFGYVWRLADIRLFLVG